MDFIKKVHWLGHASVRIDGKRIIYIDPWNVADEPKADLILITHDHYDHCSPDDVERISKEDTVIVAPSSCKNKLSMPIREVSAGTELDVCNVKLMVVNAYNLSKPFHTKESGGVGYLFTVDSVILYHAGDTDAIEDMEGLKPDIAFLPVGGTYTMDPAQAAEAVKKLQPGLVVPIHYGSIVGNIEDAKRFAELSSAPVEIIPPEAKSG